MRKLLPLLAIALAACGGGSSDSKKVPNVALFIDTDYVDYTVDDIEAEAYTMEAALAAMDGVTTTTCTVADLETVIAGKNVFVLPEQENGFIASDIDDAGLALIYDFVHDQGGELIMARPSNGALALLNDAFGYSLVSVASPAGSMDLTASAAGTIFEGGAASLLDLSATDLVSAASLPAGAKVMYADDNGDAAVVVIPSGSGNIIVLGWDWYDAAPAGAEDGGWLDVFEAAVNY